MTRGEAQQRDQANGILSQSMSCVLHLASDAADALPVIWGSSCPRSLMRSSLFGLGETVRRERHVCETQAGTTERLNRIYYYYY